MEWAGTTGLATLRRTNLPRVALRIALAALIAWSFVESSRPILQPRRVCRHHRANRVARLPVGCDELLVVESRNASDLHVLALPLAYIYAKPVLVLNSPKPDKLAFAKFVGWARQRYRQVYFLGGGGTDLLSSSVGVEPVVSERFQVPEYESRRNAYPTRVRGKRNSTTACIASSRRRRHAASSRSTSATKTTSTSSGSTPKERDRRGTFRWTQRQSYLSLPALTADRHELVLWMQNGGRPPKAPPARVAAFIGDQPIGTLSSAPRCSRTPFPIANPARSATRRRSAW